MWRPPESWHVRARPQPRRGGRSSRVLTWRGEEAALAATVRRRRMLPSRRAPLLATLALVAACAGGSASTPAPSRRGIVHVPARGGAGADFRLLRGDTAVEVTIRAKGKAATAPRAIVA